MRLAASLERSSEHPLAAAVIAAAKEKGITAEEPADFASVTGKGVTGTVGGRRVALGNAKLMADQKDRHWATCLAKADELRGSGATALFVAVDGKPGGVIAIADPIKADHAGGARQPARGRHPRRHADRRQPDDGPGRGQAARHR